MAGAPQRPGPPQQAPAQGGGGGERRKPAPAAPAAPAEAAPPAKGGGRRGAMLPAIVVAVALLAAAFLLRGGGGDDSAAVSTSPTSAPPVEEPGNPAHVVALDAVTLNLKDGSLAKVGIAIEIADPAVLEEIGEDAGGYGARALDELIQIMGERTAEDLQGDGKSKVKEELTTRVGEAYHGEVVAVYFTELVIP